MILAQLLADQVAGGGDYVFYVTLQVGGAGSEYVLLPKTTATAAAGETTIGGQSIFITVRSGDVVRAYIDGLAGDTTTPDTMVRFFELDAATAAALAAVAATLAASSAILDNVTAGSITKYRGDYWSIALTGLGDLTDYVSIDFMIKQDKSNADTESILWVRKNASGLTDGLLRVNGAAVADPYASTDGSLTPDVPLTGGTGTLVVKAIVTKDLRAESNLCFEIQVTFASGPTTRRAGMFHVSADVVRAIS
jgi:hypothetical protein